MPAHQCGEARWFYNERGGPYECRKTHTYAVWMCVCVCVCVSPHLLPLSPTLSCLVHFTPLTGSGSSSTTEEEHTTAPNPVTAQILSHLRGWWRSVTGGQKAWDMERRGKSSLYRYSQDMICNQHESFRISVYRTRKEEVCLKMSSCIQSLWGVFSHINVFKIHAKTPRILDFSWSRNGFSKKLFISKVL